jgi:hypothetical protein
MLKPHSVNDKTYKRKMYCSKVKILHFNCDAGIFEGQIIITDTTTD